MKKIFLFLIIGSFLGACATKETKFADQLGNACFPKTEKDGSVYQKCISIRTDANPVRFHKMSDYERKHLQGKP